MPVPPSWGWKDDHPIVNVTWADAQAYCGWAGVRLPKESEWEKAAHGEDGRTFPWGNTFDNTKLWCSVSEKRDSTAPVGSFPAGASPCGALDMAGNVWQWCEDRYDTEHDWRVVRGGSWSSTNPVDFRAASRLRDDPVYRGSDLGFRCASGP